MVVDILIYEMIIPFKNNKKIDLEVFKELLKENLKYADYVLIFTSFGEGNLLSYREKEKILSSIDKEDLDKIIYYFKIHNFELDKKEIKIIKKYQIQNILLSPIDEIYSSQVGLYLYIKNIIKKLKETKIFLHNPSSNKYNYFHYSTLKKLFSLFSNIVGIYENSQDYSLLNLIKTNHPPIKIFLNEKNVLEVLNKNYDGIVSFTSIIYYQSYISIFNDFQNNYIDTILISYLNLAYDILYFNNNSTLIKAYLSKKGYSSMNVRLPLIIDKIDEENLELLLS